MAVCQSCGAEAADGAAYCGSCGAVAGPKLPAPGTMIDSGQASPSYGQPFAPGYDQGQGAPAQGPLPQGAPAQGPPPQGAPAQGQPYQAGFEQYPQASYPGAGYSPTVQPYQAGYGPVPVAPPKSKTAAILLAVFLSFWTWLYTYQRDSSKFWIGLGVAVGGWVLGVLLAFVFVGFILMLAPLGVWVWAIVDTATKPEQYYLRYPAG